MITDEKIRKEERKKDLEEIRGLDIPLEQLPTLVTLDWNLQRARMALVQQINALRVKKVDTTYLEDRILAPLLELEEFGEMQLKKCVHNHPLWGWLKHIGGIGEKFTAQLIYLITGKKHTEECQEKRDKYFAKKEKGEAKRARTFKCDCPVMEIERFHSVSALWKYAGMSTESYCKDCGKNVDDKAKSCPHCESTNIGRRAPRRIKGQKVTWNPKLRSVCRNIGKSFVMNISSPYRPHYDADKEYYNLKDPHLSAGHRDARARRKTVKLFLSHLYEMWHRVKGLEPPKSYVEEKLGHVHRIPPPESEEARRELEEAKEEEARERAKEE